MTFKIGALLVDQTVLISDTTTTSAEVLTHQINVRQAHLKVPQQSKEEYTADEILSRVEISKLGEAAASHQIDIRNVIASGEMNEEKRKEIMKAIVEKHMMESAKLESDLRQSEIKAISDILEDVEKKKEKIASDIKQELKERLKEAKTDEEREEIILEYAKKLQDAANELQDEKVRRLKDKREKLKKERMSRKKDLMR